MAKVQLIKCNFCRFLCAVVLATYKISKLGVTTDLHTGPVLTVVPKRRRRTAGTLTGAQCGILCIVADLHTCSVGTVVTWEGVYTSRLAGTNGVVVRIIIHRFATAIVTNIARTFTRYLFAA